MAIGHFNRSFESIHLLVEYGVCGTGYAVWGTRYGVRTTGYAPRNVPGQDLRAGASCRSRVFPKERIDWDVSTISLRTQEVMCEFVHSFRIDSCLHLAGPY